MQAVLESEEGQDRYLLAGLALAAECAGQHLGPDDVYSFRIPPVLGGLVDVSNVEVMSFTVAASINGQIHRQVKDLPPGSPISGVTVDGPDPSKPRKRRGLFGRRN